MSFRLLAFTLASALVGTACGTDADVGAAAPTASADPSEAGPADLVEPGPEPAFALGPHGYDERVVAVTTVPSMPRGMAHVDGLVWVAAARTDEVVAIDPASDEVVVRLEPGELPVTLVASETGELWVAVLNGDATGASTELVRIDTAAREVGQRVAVPAFHAIPVVGSSAWALGHDATVRRVDLADGQVVAEAEVDPETIWIGADDQAVWGVTGAGTAWRLDASTLEVTHEVELGFEVPGRSRVAVGDGRFWVAARGRIVALDAATGEVVVDLDRPSTERVNDLDVVDGHAWITLVERDPSSPRGEGRLLQLDGEGATVGQWAMGEEPSELVVHGAFVWIGDQEAVEVVRLPR